MLSISAETSAISALIRWKIKEMFKNYNSCIQDFFLSQLFKMWIV